jgi:hypothetical protein
LASRRVTQCHRLRCRQSAQSDVAESAAAVADAAAAEAAVAAAGSGAGGTVDGPKDISCSESGRTGNWPKGYWSGCM